MSSSLKSHGLYSPWNSSGQNTGVGSLSLLQGIFPTQVSRIAGGFFTSWVTREAPKSPSFCSVKVKITQSCPTLCDLMDCSLLVSSVHGILQARILEWVAIPSPGDLPNPGIEPRSPALQADLYQLSHQGSPRILEQGAYPFSRGSSWCRQGSNWGFLHCRQILYHLSHQGSPRILEQVAYPYSGGSSQPRNEINFNLLETDFILSLTLQDMKADS